MTDHARLLIDELRDLVAAIDRDHPTVAHWLNAKRGHHPRAASYDSSTSGGEVRDLSAVVTLTTDPTDAQIKRYRRRLDDAVRALRDVDHIRRNNLTTTSLPTVIDPPKRCSHCGREDRYRGDLGRRCYDWKAAHAGQLPDDDVLRAWAQGKQPKVRIP